MRRLRLWWALYRALNDRLGWSPRWLDKRIAAAHRRERDRPDDWYWP